MRGAVTRRLRTWAQRRKHRVAGRNPWLVGVSTVESSVADRVTGLAAEMAFFALLSAVPLVVALGASLGWLEVILGREAIERGQAGVLEALGTVFSGEATEEVLEPLVSGLLNEQRGGVALSGVLVALWLASRVCTAAIRALDLAYGVEDRRNLFEQRALALAFAVGAVLTVSVTLLFAVLGPLLGSGQELARDLGLGEAFAATWELGRWPLLVLVAVGFYAAVYRYGPNVDNTWRQCLPGAVLGVVLWLAASFGFRLYLQVVGSPIARFEVGSEAGALLGVVGGITAAVLWTYLSSLSLLIGGELNSVLWAPSTADGRAAPAEAGTSGPAT